jgi:hypothetical protein
MGILTPYGAGPSPVYYGSGYLPASGSVYHLKNLADFSGNYTHAILNGVQRFPCCLIV